MESHVEHPPLPGLAAVVRTVWIQCTGESADVQRHLPTGGVEIHFSIGGQPQLVGPLTGPAIEVIPPVLDDLVDQRLGLAVLRSRTSPPFCRMARRTTRRCMSVLTATGSSSSPVRGMRKARNLRRDPRLALSITPVDNPYQPVVIRGRVVEWIEGDAAWEIIDQLAKKYTGAPYPREQERVVIVVEPERQIVGVG